MSAIVGRTMSILLLLCTVLPTVGAATSERSALSRFTFQTFYYSDVALELNDMGVAIAPDTKRLELYYQYGSDFRQVSFGRNRLGLAHEFRGQVPFRLYHRHTNAEGEVEMVPVAQLGGEFEHGGNYIILVEGMNQGLRLIAVDVSPERLPSGGLLVMNATSRMLAADTGGGAPKVIPGGGSGVVIFKTSEDHSFHLRMASEGDDGWELIRSSSVTQVGDDPLLMIVYPDARREGRWQTRFLNLKR